MNSSFNRLNFKDWEPYLIDAMELLLVKGHLLVNLKSWYTLWLVILIETRFHQPYCRLLISMGKNPINEMCCTHIWFLEYYKLKVILALHIFLFKSCPYFSLLAQHEDSTRSGNVKNDFVLCFKSVMLVPWYRPTIDTKIGVV